MSAIGQRSFSGGSPQLNRELGTFARDVFNAIAGLVGFALVEFDALYTEPMYVGSAHEPKAILCVRVRNLASPETPLLCGAAVHFVWEQSATRSRVTSIDGLTAGTTKYRFTFLVVG